MTGDEVAALRMAVRNLPHLHMGTAVHAGARLDRLHPDSCAACARMVIEHMLDNHHGEYPNFARRELAARRG